LIQEILAKFFQLIIYFYFDCFFQNKKNNS
jgi:hypothetical protein